MINGLTLYPTCHGAVVGITDVMTKGRLVRLREIWPLEEGAWSGGRHFFRGSRDGTQGARHGSRNTRATVGASGVVSGYT
jgi:hypothetical protein